MRKNIAAGNWKMNTTVKEGIQLYNNMSKKDIPNEVLTIVGVPCTHLSSIIDAKDDRIKVAAQNCHFKNSGAYTGEISPSTLADMGVDYVILGHSERREYFNEDNSLLAQKTNAALAEGLQVIFCCGEPLNIRKEGNQINYVERQLIEGLFHLNAEQMDSITIAYEPIWAIGTGETATADQAQEMHAHIRKLLAAQYSDETAANVSILYGGSVKPANAEELFGCTDVDGGLVGGASLDVDSFDKIIHSFKK